MITSMQPTGERIGRWDIVTATGLSALALAFVLSQVGDEARDVPVAAAPLALAITLPVLWRRVAPLAAITASLVAIAVYAVLFKGGGLVTCGFTVPVGLVYAYTAGAWLPQRESRIGLGLSVAFMAAIGLTDGPDGATPDAIVLLAPIATAVWGAGRLVRSRTAMASELEARTTALREARDERARLEVATDRTRLSAELDELLQRRLAELSRLAEEGEHAADPVGALTEIEQTSRRTLEEMRAVVGVLRSDEAPTAPQPALTHLDALLVRESGASARLEVDGSLRALPPAVELSAYRVVEHLLAALEQAPDVRVRVHVGDDALEIEVQGPARRDARAALELARERVRLHAGSLELRTEHGRAQARASLPIYAAV